MTKRKALKKVRLCGKELPSGRKVIHINNEIIVYENFEYNDKYIYFTVNVGLFDYHYLYYYSKIKKIS